MLEQGVCVCVCEKGVCVRRVSLCVRWVCVCVLEGCVFCRVQDRQPVLGEGGTVGPSQMVHQLEIGNRESTLPTIKCFNRLVFK